MFHTNDVNGGLLDDPEENDEPQYAWLVKTLQNIKEAEEGKRLVLALHYPPYSGAANFSHRGDPNLGPTPRRNPGAGLLQPLAVTLRHAFQQAGLYPDLVISAHSHLYERITYTYTGGQQIPYLIAGSGGHWPVEKMAEACDKSLEPDPTTPFPVVLPPGSRVTTRRFSPSRQFQRYSLWLPANHSRSCERCYCRGIFHDRRQG
jgi:hypothetical protein